MLLNAENYKKGFLVDNDLVGGVSEHPERDGDYIAFILQHTTGEYLGYQSFKSLDEALAAINNVERDWVFEAASNCTGGCGHHHGEGEEHGHGHEHGCGSGGGCGGCGKHGEHEHNHGHEHGHGGCGGCGGGCDER